MREFHQRLARIGLETVEQYGFVLAGGYALSANGIGDRPSVDVDLFTDDTDQDAFSRAVEAVVSAFEDAGLEVSVLVRGRLFLNLDVREPATGENSQIQLGWDFREFPPTRLWLGPVLHRRDAVANKMTALFSRGEVRDFIDIDTVVEAGVFTRDEVLALADTREALPLDREMLAERFTMIGKYSETQFEVYGVGAAQREAMVERFAQWAQEIVPDR